MPVKIKYFIKTIKSRKDLGTDEEVNIRIRFSNGRSFDLTALSGKQISPDYWNNDKGVIRQRAAFKNSDEFQQKLNSLSDSIKEEFDNTPDKSTISAQWLNQTIEKFYNPAKFIKSTYTLFTFVEYFIANADKRINPHTGNPVVYEMRSEYGRTFYYLKKYAELYGEPNFENIDMVFYNQFVELLRKEPLKTNTIGKKIETLKTFLNAATELGYNHIFKYKSKIFKALSEDIDSIYLTKDEISKFYKHDFSKNPSLERVRDLFIIECWTGLRYSDMRQVVVERVSGGLLKIKQKKTGNNAVIPIHPIVQEIFNKYKGNLPPTISNQKYNDYLQIAAKEAVVDAPFTKSINIKGMVTNEVYHKYELISSHTARRSFCTNAYKDGIPTLAIMSMSGHKTERAFLKYIKVSNEEHAQIALNIWNKSLPKKPRKPRAKKSKTVRRSSGRPRNIEPD